MNTPSHVPMTKSKRDALHLCYDTMEDLTLKMLFTDNDVPPNTRSVIAEIVAQRGDQAELEREDVEWDLNASPGHLRRGRFTCEPDGSSSDREGSLRPEVHTPPAGPRQRSEDVMTQYYEIERHRVRQVPVAALAASDASLRRVATVACALLLSMDVDEAMGLGAFGEERDRLRTAIRDLDSCIGVELEHGPLTAELAAEKAVEDAVCPECHGTKRVTEEVLVACRRCGGSGQIDPFDFGIRPAQVARGRDAS